MVCQNPVVYHHFPSVICLFAGIPYFLTNSYLTFHTFSYSVNGFVTAKCDLVDPQKIVRSNGKTPWTRAGFFGSCPWSGGRAKPFWISEVGQSDSNLQQRMGHLEGRAWLLAGWWFGTCFFPVGNNNPNGLSDFSEGLKPPTSWGDVFSS